MLKKRICLAIAVAACAASGALADGNQLFISQDSTLGGPIGNTLFVDQSLANSSIISGALGSDTPAAQIGSGNTARIAVTSVGNEVALNQTNLTGGNPNAIIVNLSGVNAAGSATQIGFGNEGILTATGLGSNALLEQTGNLNIGEVVVSGDGASGTLIQNGNNNRGDLTVVTDGTTVVFTQNGNGITGALPSVTTNGTGGTISVTQTSITR